MPRAGMYSVSHSCQISSTPLMPPVMLTWVMTSMMPPKIALPAAANGPTR